MAVLDVNVVLERAKKAFSDRDLNRQIYEDCYEYYQPYKNTFSGSSDSSLNKPTKVYNSTGMISAANFVNNIQANFTPVFTRWAELKAGPGIPEKKRTAINKELSNITDLIFSYLNASNFSTATAEMYFDWGIGTGCLWLFEGDETSPLNFIASPMSQMGFLEGKFGTIDSRFREHKIKARLIKATYPQAKIGDDLAKVIRDNPDEDICLIEACYYDYEMFVWRYEVIHEKTKDRIVQMEFADEICFTPRWMKIPGQASGIGPFILALLDVKTLSKMSEFTLRAAALNIFGAYTVASGAVFNPNAATISPASFIPVERNGGPNGPTIAALPRSGDFQAQEFLMNDLRDNIRKTLLDNRMPEETPQPKTAFEIAQRIKEFQVNIGSAYGRAMFEFVQPLFKRIISILVKKGLLKLPDDFTLDNFFYMVHVVSPVAQAQAMEDVQKLTQVMQIVGGVNPALVPINFEIESLARWLTENTGAPAAMLRDERQAEEMQAMIAQMAAGQMQQQGAQGNATTA